MSAKANLERRRQAIYGWLLLSPAAVLLIRLCVLPVGSDPVVEPVFARHAPQPTEFVGTKTTPNSSQTQHSGS